MLNLDAFKPNWRCAAAAFGALAIGTISFSGSAAATPLQLFPFIMAPPAQWAPPPVRSAPSEDEGPIVEMPARFKRQIAKALGRRVAPLPKGRPSKAKAQRQQSSLL